MSKLEEKLNEIDSAITSYRVEFGMQDENGICTSDDAIILKLISALRKAIEQRNELELNNTERAYCAYAEGTDDCETTVAYVENVEKLNAEILQILEGE